MTHCIQCHRPMKRASVTGMGPVCSKRFAAPVLPAVDRDLFGFDAAKACASVLQRLEIQNGSSASDAMAALRVGLRAEWHRVRVALA